MVYNYRKVKLHCSSASFSLIAALHLPFPSFLVETSDSSIKYNERKFLEVILQAKKWMVEQKDKEDKIIDYMAISNHVLSVRAVDGRYNTWRLWYGGEFFVSKKLRGSLLAGRRDNLALTERAERNIGILFEKSLGNVKF